MTRTCGETLPFLAVLPFLTVLLLLTVLPFSLRSLAIAQDAPSTLNAPSPIRVDSSLTRTRPTPSSSASAGSSVSSVGR